MTWLKRGGIVAAVVAVTVALATCGGAEELFQTVEERVAEAGAVETFSVTYDGNGNDSGTVPVDDRQYPSGASVTVSDKGSIALTGQSFGGWSTAADTGGVVYHAGDTFEMPSADVTLYAQWFDNVYDLTVTAGAGGSISAPSATTTPVGHGVATSLVALPDTGYRFKRWTVTSGSPAIEEPLAASTSVVLINGGATLLAEFELMTYELDVMAGTGGSIVQPSSLPTTVQHGVATTISAASAGDFAFARWVVTAGSASTTVANRYDATTTVTLAGSDATVQAEFDPLYSVTYYGNGTTAGYPPEDDGLYLQDATFTVQGNQNGMVRVQDGITCIFEGWNTRPDGYGTEYQPGSQFTVQDVDVALFAQWTVIGAEGPAGGTVFYERGTEDQYFKYISAAPEDFSISGDYYLSWGPAGTALGGTDAAVWGAWQNTYDQSMSSEQALSYIVSEAYINGQNDWLLPSTGDLRLMYERLHLNGAGGFNDYPYWTSTESNADDAQTVHFSPASGQTFHTDKSFERRVRPVRYFGH